jgi:hypothetical protein
MAIIKIRNKALTLLDTANSKIAGENLDISFENITDTGTEGTKVASGTSAQRGSTTGQIRFNTTLGLAEYYTGTEFKAIDTPPSITSLDVTNIETDLGGTQTFVISGSLFSGSATVKFRDNGGTLITPDTTTVNSASQITVTKTRSSFLNANEPYDVIVTNPSGLEAVLDDQINVDNTPTWTTASGNVASIFDTDTGTHATVSATDADGDTIVYSETTSVLSGAGLSLNSSTGAITGDPTDLASGSTTYNFTARATANGKTADRAFNIIVAKRDGTTEAGAVTDASTLLALNKGDGNYWFKNGSDSAYQAYYLGTVDGGGWTYLCSMSNAVSDHEYWTSSGTHVNTDTRIGQTTTVGTLTSLTKNSSKAPAFWNLNFNKILFYVNFGGTIGWERYNFNHNNTLQHFMLNNTSTHTAPAYSNRQQPFTGTIYMRNAYNNDGGIFATTGIVGEASGGLIMNVDGNYGNSWAGEITRNDSNRFYANDGTTTDHTVWVFGKA